jgi:hypothetical protein
MRIIKPGGSRLLLVGAALFMLLLSPWAARGDEPTLVVHLLDGQTHLYPVTQIERVLFADSTLSVVMASATDQYAASAIRRLDFNWTQSGVLDPTQAAAALKAMRLFQNKPNPFSTQTLIGFRLPASGRVGLQIVGADGRLIRTLVNQNRAAGNHEVTWDGLDNAGRKMPSGVYFYELTGPNLREGRQMIYLP